MAAVNEELTEWYEKFQKIPFECHLLCPRTNDDDEEDYKSSNDPHSQITVDEKNTRIQQGEERLEITYWNSLIFGFDKQDAGKWLDEFKTRLEGSLKYCADCVLNWHMKRKYMLQQFSE